MFVLLKDAREKKNIYTSYNVNCYNTASLIILFVVTKGYTLKNPGTYTSTLGPWDNYGSS